MKAERPSKKLPPNEEWDFRGVELAAVKAATLYEYARETKSLRNRINHWLDSPNGGESVRQVLRGLFEKKSNLPPFKRVWLSHREIIVKGLNLQLSHDLVKIVSARPDFPEPWLKSPVPSANIRPTLRCIPIADKIAHAKKRCPSDPLGWYQASLMGPEYELKIAWGNASIEDIAREFSEWLKEEAKKWPRKRKGAPAHNPTSKLKALAALRLSKAGFSFDAAMNALPKKYDPTVGDTRPKLLPLFTDKQAWDKACKRAAEEILRLEIF